MLVSELFRKTGKKVITVRPQDTVETTSTLLATNNIGALPVRDENGDLVAMISERDIVRGFAENGGQAQHLLVSDLMSPRVVTCAPEETVGAAMVLMSQNRIRHLPVVEDGKMVGIISSRDVMGAIIEEMRLERDVLREMAIIQT
jgi:CBS domain-containing protein